MLNAANEVAVASFLAGGIGFPDIVRTVAEALGRSELDAPGSIDDVIEIDRATRLEVDSIMKANA